MLTLLLLRHAKAERSAPGSDDFERHLKAKGQAAALAIGRYAAANGFAPRRVLCSPSARTRETWEIASREFGEAPSVQFVRSLYDFGGEQSLLATIRKQPDAVSPLMLVGHNPSTEELALYLAAPGGALWAQMAAKFPTAGLAVLRFGTMKWRDIAKGSGELLAFVRPADLIGGSDD